MFEVSRESSVKCPNSACDGFSDFIKVPLKEDFIDENLAKVYCPYCGVELNLCENCVSLIIVESYKSTRDSQRGRTIRRDKYLSPSSHSRSKSRSRSPSPTLNGSYCRKCGFFNLSGPSIRSLLQLPDGCHMDIDLLRIMQRCISESAYIFSKTDQLKKLNTYIEANQQSSGDKSNIENPFPDSKCESENLCSILNKQINAFTNYEQRIKDLSTLQKYHFRERVKSFTQNSLLILKSLYNSSLTQPLSEIFDTIQEFLNHQSNILYFKLENELASIISTKQLQNTQPNKPKDNYLSVSPPLDVNSVLTNIILNKQDRLRKLFVHITAPYVPLLVKISKEKKELYKMLQRKQRYIQNQSKSQPILNTLSVGIWTESAIKRDLQLESELDLLIRKLILWRGIYRSLSACVL